MEKIILLVPSRTVNDEDLIALLKALFPECEIVIISRDKRDFDAAQSNAESIFDEIE